ncbi:hypothetical protein AVEN_131513-1 [Araneus ventricosus]|uniref:Uncharacterized protein n=1 Tax=Araneus ventricosus TaxID=182803 RepID=A0A4Y2KEB3_ARAVE|nr:hypothetical protein AVEN_131513-1 [Araneus ventricosus]
MALGQMTRTTPEMASPSPNICITPAGGRLHPYVIFNVQQAPTHGGSSVESGSEHGTLRPRSRDLITRLPRPQKEREIRAESPGSPDPPPPTQNVVWNFQFNIRGL